MPGSRFEVFPAPATCRTTPIRSASRRCSPSSATHRRARLPRTTGCRRRRDGDERGAPVRARRLVPGRGAARRADARRLGRAFDPPEARPPPRTLFEHIAGRMRRAPRYRQRLAGVPLACTTRSGSTTRRSTRRAPAARDGPDLDALVDALLSPLRATGRCGRSRSPTSCRRRRSRSSARCTTAWSTAPPWSSSATCCSTPSRTLAREPAPTVARGARAVGGERLARAALERRGRAALALAPARRDLAARVRRLPASRRGARAGPHPAAARARLAAEPPRLGAPPPRPRHPPASTSIRAVHGALRRDAERRRARGLRRRAAALRRAPRRAAALAQGDGPRRRALERRRRRHRQPDLVPVHPAAVRRARPGRAAAGGQPRDRAAPARRRGRGPRRRVPGLARTPARSSARSRARSRTRGCSTSPSRASRGRPCRATCAAAGCATSTPRSRWPAATRVSIGVVTVAGNACFAITADPRRCPTPTRSARPRRRGGRAAQRRALTATPAARSMNARRPRRWTHRPAQPNRARVLGECFGAKQGLAPAAGGTAARGRSGRARSDVRAEPLARGTPGS